MSANYPALFFDAETGVNNVGDEAVGKMAASPYCADNRIVVAGHAYVTDSSAPTVVEIEESSANKLVKALLAEHKPHPCALVIQNSAFDIAYLLEEVSRLPTTGLLDHLVRALFSVDLWDTMIVEYLLSAQELTFASLDDLCYLHGGVMKDSRIKEYWKSGWKTEDIPREELLPYLENDVINLRTIYEGQYAEAERLGMLPLIRSQMKARMATIIMEWEGMMFDKERAAKTADTLREAMEQTENDLKKFMNILITGGDWNDEDFNPSSSAQVLALLTGGDFTRTVLMEQRDSAGELVVFKSGAKKGQPKLKPVKETVSTSGLLHGSISITSTGVDTLKGLMKNTMVHDGIKSGLIEPLLKYRDLKKQVTTYFDGYRTLTWPNGLIHGTLNHCQTATGRLSSSNPNLQNISNKETEVE